MEMNYPISTMDVLPTLIELAGNPSDPVGWPIDGHSLVPYLTGAETVRIKPIGHLSASPWKVVDPEVPFDNITSCEDRPVQTPPSFPADFDTPFSQEQFSWTEGNLKLFACTPKRSSGSWTFSLYVFSLEGLVFISFTVNERNWFTYCTYLTLPRYDVVADMFERNDLWTTLGATTGDAMFQRALVWMESVENSVKFETQCTLGPTA